MPSGNAPTHAPSAPSLPPPDSYRRYLRILVPESPLPSVARSLVITTLSRSFLVPYPSHFPLPKLIPPNSHSTVSFPRQTNSKHHALASHDIEPTCILSPFSHCRRYPFALRTLALDLPAPPNIRSAVLGIPGPSVLSNRPSSRHVKYILVQCAIETDVHSHQGLPEQGIIVLYCTSRPSRLHPL